MPTPLSYYGPGVLVWVQFLCPLVVEGFLFGAYTGGFVLYLYLHAMNTLKASDAKRILIYPLCMLYGLSAVNFAFDIKDTLIVFGFVIETSRELCLHFTVTKVVISSFYFLISQSILIYRCWIVWGRRTSVAIIPLLLAFTALGTTLSQIRGETCISKVPSLYKVNRCLYLAIDGLVMGLIVLKIVMVYLGVRPVMAYSGRENKFRPLVFIFFIVIESGSVLFAVQLCYVILSLQPVLNSTGLLADSFITNILTQVPLNGIIPTIILVREALGMSYNGTTPLSQTIESLHFAHNDTSVNSNQEVEQWDAQASDAQDIVEVNRSSTS
ncbi:hypothetical protein BYT27DRAFT_7189152 [Phlegmacium glaucopus]|nr:hypothetical protein BYT27DRAFT_7189152 [Phlegmacium glaucopus]